MEEYLTTENLLLLVTVLLGISEALAQIPQVKANSIFQLVALFLRKLVGKGRE